MREPIVPTSILVTGGAGFIGANLVRMLTRKGFDVTVFDDLSVGSWDRLDGLNVRRIEGTVLDADAIRQAIEGHDAVVHLAAQTGVPLSVANPRRDCEINVLGTLNVLEGARNGGANGTPARVVFASSNAPLGRQTPPASEEKAPLPMSPYGASKLAGEGYCLAYHGTWGVPTVVLRFANVYGPFSAHKGSVVAQFFKDILDGRPIVIHGDGGQTRDFIFVEDLCRAVLLALRSDVGGEVFQIATGRETSIATLAAMVGDLTGQSGTIRHEEGRAGDIRANYSSIEKATRVLSWRPDVPLEEGLRQTWEWIEGATSSSRAAVR